jgi:outer membrane receptor for ferrienterochelin and colicin
MSGAVNVVTREGRKNYFGTLETVTDALAGSWIGAPVAGYNVYAGSFGGPVLPSNDKLTFYGSAERRWQQDRSPSSLSTQYEDAILALGTREGLKPNNTSGGYTFQGKLAWQLNDNMDLKASGSVPRRSGRSTSTPTCTTPTTRRGTTTGTSRTTARSRTR